MRVGGIPPTSDREPRAYACVPDERASWHKALKRGYSWHWSGRELSHPLRCPPLPLPGLTEGAGEEVPGVYGGGGRRAGDGQGSSPDSGTQSGHELEP